MLDALQLSTVAVVPLNETWPVPCVDPKLLPVIFTTVPTCPLVGLKAEIRGDSLPAHVAGGRDTPINNITTRDLEAKL
jgi:hypothetical protein